MPPWSSSARSAGVCCESQCSVAASWLRPDLHLGTRMMSYFQKHYCPRVRFMVKVWSFLCMLSSWPDCRTAPCEALSAPVGVCVSVCGGRNKFWHKLSTWYDTAPFMNVWLHFMVWGESKGYSWCRNKLRRKPAASWKATQKLCTEVGVCKGCSLCCIVLFLLLKKKKREREPETQSFKSLSLIKHFLQDAIGVFEPFDRCLLLTFQHHKCLILSLRYCTFNETLRGKTESKIYHWWNKKSAEMIIFPLADERNRDFRIKAVDEDALNVVQIQRCHTNTYSVELSKEKEQVLN